MVLKIAECININFNGCTCTVLDIVASKSQSGDVNIILSLLKLTKNNLS